MKFRLLLVALLPTIVFATLVGFAQLAADAVGVNATIEDQKIFTVEGIGAGQGVNLHDGHLYFYGDVSNGETRAGIVREFSLDLNPTGREIELSQDGIPVLTHPTGLTWDDHWGCFLGDTVHGVANIYCINWDKAIESGNLNDAIVAHIVDDAAVNGCRPEFVKVNGKTLLATADYGNTRPSIRLYDVERTLAAKRTSASGVLAHTIECGPFNQNLYWDAEMGDLVCIQNVAGGIGWRLDRIDLAAAVREGNVAADGVRKSTCTFSSVTELEGYRPLPGGKCVFVTASAKRNVSVGRIVARAE